VRNPKLTNDEAKAGGLSSPPRRREGRNDFSISLSKSGKIERLCTERGAKALRGP
jgi:hypothetical protein